MNRYTHWLAAAAAAVALDAGANQYTDLWWNPEESGWGANIVHQGDTAFVTLFVYDADGKPTWFVAPGATTFAYDDRGRPAFRGTLYRTRGPWLGGPFDPAKVAVAAIGTMTIEPAPGDSIRLYYDVEGLSVVKDLVRQTFDLPAFGATYHGSFSLRQARPGESPYGTRMYPADVLFHVEQGQAFLRIEETFSRCEYRGPYAQSGKYARIAGDYTCQDGSAGTFEITDFEIARHGITGYLRTWSPANNQYGRFAATFFF